MSPDASAPESHWEAVREARVALDQVSSDDRMSEAQITAAITEAQKERDEARAELKERQETLEQAVAERASALAERNWANERYDEAQAEVKRVRAELKQVREKNGSLADRIEKTDSELRDAWRAEDHLRSTLRLLWEEAQDESRCQVEAGYGHHISQPCEKAVVAALKEGDR